MARTRVLTWHVHGGYLEALGQTGLELVLPILPDETPGYGGRAGLPLPAYVTEVPADRVRDVPLDAVLYQSARNWTDDRWAILSPAQRALPQAYLEHDPPREHPTDTRHIVDDPAVTIVQCTHFNALMWDTGPNPVRVIEHGVPDPDVRWDGGMQRGIAVINDLDRRGRRAGRDLVLRAWDEGLPVDLVGLRSEALGGLGPIPHAMLPTLMASYRVFFHPARYTSLGLAVIEAMLIGMPVVAPATTEIVTVIEDGRSGIVATDTDRLMAGMRTLLDDLELARRLGEAGRAVARRRFSMERFSADWTVFFAELTASRPLPVGPVASVAGGSR